MANEFLKPEVIVKTLLGLLEREIVLPALVWRDAVGDFKGAKDDTVSIRLPAYTVARTRTLRAGTPVTLDELTETKVDVVLDTDVYKAVPLTDENLTLDIVDFGAQVLQPVVSSVARGLEDALGDTITGATYETTLELDNADPYGTAVDARKALNDAEVPKAGRAIVCGSSIEANFLKSERFVRVDQSGTDSALREAQIGRVAGFDVFQSNAIPPNEAYAFHRTAYILATRAPVVPEGATSGTTATFAGLAMRVLRDYDFLNTRDRLLADVFMGSQVVEDLEDIEDPDSDTVMKRAVKIEDAES